MKSLFTVILTLISFTVLSQVTNLDEKRGFKEIKLGDTYEKWKDDIAFVRNDSETKKYKFKGDCCSAFYEYNIPILFLDFYKEEVVSIYAAILYTESINEEYSSLKPVFDDLHNKLVATIGREDKFDHNESDSHSSYSWTTDRTFARIRFHHDDLMIIFTVQDMEAYHQRLDEGF